MSTRIIRRLSVAVQVCALSLTWMPAPARAQLNTFSSGSTGADGAFSPTSNQVVTLPESGVLNFTTVTIPSNVSVFFTHNSKNTPVTILATGNVTIAGQVRVDGQGGLGNGGGGIGGPGGFNGGMAGFGFDTFVGTTGDGPGGGGGGSSTNGANFGGGGGGGYALNGTSGAAQNANSVGGQGGSRYGASSLLPLIGGSGGGGGGSPSGTHGGAGGGGGGALLIASSTSISLTGLITALGGNGIASSGGGGGGGSGGAVRLAANTITGAGTIDVRAGSGAGSSAANGGVGAVGLARIEAFDFSAFNPSIPSNSGSFAMPNPVTVPNAPALRIASVAGVNAPAVPLGSLAGQPDIVVPTTTTNPVAIAIEATNVPIGTVVQVTLIPANGPRVTAPSSALAGTLASSTATVSISLPSGTSVLTASAVIDTSQTAMIIDGERVNRIEIAATYRGPSRVTYVTQSGRRVSSNSQW